MENQAEKLRKLGFTENQIINIEKIYKAQQEFVVSENPQKYSEMPEFKVSIKPASFRGYEKKEEMDLCVNCGKETPYPKSIDIQYRMNYVEGAGRALYRML